MAARLYEQLFVWQEAHALCLEVNKVLPKFPAEEQYSFGGNLRRTAAKIPLLIVEGNNSRSKKGRIQYSQKAKSGLELLDYMLLLSRDLKYITNKRFEKFRSAITSLSVHLEKFKQGLSAK